MHPRNLYSLAHFFFSFWQLCVQKLRIFVEDQDQNLKYLGLQAMASVLKINPKFVSAQRDLILSCLDDQDESIRLKALDLLGGMVSKKNLTEIVKKLLSHLEVSEGATYRDEVVGKIISICSQDHYQYITNFEWYLQVLIQLTRVEGTRLGKQIAFQLMDVTIRVAVIRDMAAKQLAALLGNSHLQSGSNQKNGVCEVLYAAAYITGEFADHLEEPLPVLEMLLQPRVSSLPGHIQSVYIHNALKLYASVARKSSVEDETAQDVLSRMRAVMLQRMPLFVQSGDLEVQERAVTVLEIVKYANKKRDQGLNLDAEIADLFVGELNPVASKAQRKVPVPEGLDLDEWINEPPKDEEPVASKDLFCWDDAAPAHALRSPLEEEQDEELMTQRRVQRRLTQEANPFHLGSMLVV